MLTQVNDQIGAPPPATAPTVAVLGQRSRVANLPQHLPAGWAMRVITELGEVGPRDLLVLSGAGAPDVRLARAVLPPQIRIVALLDERSGGDVVAGVLSEGADVCVRAGHPGILAGHLVACRRRQLAERCAGVEPQASEPPPDEPVAGIEEPQAGVQEPVARVTGC